MSLVSQSRALGLVTLLLCLLPPCTPTGQPEDNKEDTPISDVTPQNQDETLLSVMDPSIPESCTQKLTQIVGNVTAFCEEDAATISNRPNMSCHEISSNLLKLLQSEQDQSKMCTEQLTIVKSLLQRFKQQLAGTKDQVQAMSGIAIRFQGNRTSLNDQLDNSHQQILATVDSIVLDIEDWRRTPVNTSVEESVRQRNLDQELQACKNETAEAQRAFRNKVQQLALCVDEKRSMEEGLRTNRSNCEDNMNLQFNLNKTLDELNLCNQTVLALEKERSVKEQDLRILIKESKNLEERGAELKDKYIYVMDVKDKLEVDLASAKEALERSNKKLDTESASKDRCLREKANFQMLLADKVAYLQLTKKNLTSLQLQSTASKALLQEILTAHGKLSAKTKNLKPTVEELMDALLSKHRQLGNCALQNSKLQANAKDMQENITQCKKEVKELKDRGLVDEEKLKSLQQERDRLVLVDEKLGSCNSEIAHWRKEYNELEQCYNKSRLENSRLQENINNLSNANTELQQQKDFINKVSETCNKTIVTTTELLKTAENKLMEMQQRIEQLEEQLASKEEDVKASQRENAALTAELKNVKRELNACNSEKAKQKQEFLQQYKSKNDLLEACDKHLNETKEALQNYTVWCETSQRNSEIAHQKLEQKLTEELKNATKENESLKARILSMQKEIEKCSEEKTMFRANLLNETAELKNCNTERHSLSQTIVSKDEQIADVMQDLSNLNLTSKLKEIKLNSRLIEVEMELQRLEYMLKSNRNGIKMLEEYGMVLIMLLNKNYDILRLLKEATAEGCGGNQAMVDDRFEPLLRRLLRTIEDHHSRIYVQLLQMKSHADKNCLQAVPVRVRRQVQRGRTPEAALLSAARQGNLTEAHILLLLGTNVNVQDREGMTPLHWAALGGHSALCELFLTRGAHPDIHALGRSSKTPLHLAAEEGYVDTLEVLLDFGARIEVRALDRATPLLYAAMHGRDQAVRALLERGADIRVTNIQRKTAKDLAATHSNVTAIIQEFEKKG